VTKNPGPKRRVPATGEAIPLLGARPAAVPTARSGPARAAAAPERPQAAAAHPCPTLTPAILQWYYCGLLRFPGLRCMPRAGGEIAVKFDIWGFGRPWAGPM
jgi:hypothetical protein